MNKFSSVEKHFFNQQAIKKQTSEIPYIVLDNFPQLGLITSLRFLEWASENPDGVISLPTGKTPEYFIKWTHHILNNWENKEIEKLHKLKSQFSAKLSNEKFINGAPEAIINNEKEKLASTESALKDLEQQLGKISNL